MKRKFLVEICHVGEEDIDSWVEVLWGEDEQAPYNIIKHFNLTLRPGEKARKVLGITEVISGKNRPHEWEKSNLVTIIKGGENYDTYRCRNCDVTSKRFSLGSSLIQDKKYKADKYQYCKGERKCL